MYYVYLLLLANGEIYTGYSNDLKRRVSEHLRGKVESTKYSQPSTLIFYEAFRNKLDAERRESYFKSAKGKKVLRIMLREYFAAIV